MGRKAKKIVEKIPIEDEEDDEPVQKKSGGKSTFDLKDVFSESIRGRLTQYISLN